MKKSTERLPMIEMDHKEIDLTKIKGFESFEEESDGPDVEIKQAMLKDDFCNYKYEVVSGKMKGDTCNRSGASIVHNDLKTVFKKLHVHLALSCEELDKKGIKDVDNIPAWDADADIPANLSQLQEISRKIFHFSVSSIKTDGTGENEGVTLVGQKRLSTGEYVKLESPRITWDGEYYFINELRVIVDDIKEEVEKYMNGKAAPKIEQGDLFNENNGGGDGKVED